MIFAWLLRAYNNSFNKSAYHILPKGCAKRGGNKIFCFFDFYVTFSKHDWMFIDITSNYLILMRIHLQ